MEPAAPYGNSISTIQQGHPDTLSAALELKVYQRSQRAPNPIFSKQGSLIHVLYCPKLHARTSQSGFLPFVFPKYLSRARPVMKEQDQEKRHQRERKKKKAPSEPWETFHAKFCSYWPGLGGRSYWNYCFTSRDFICLAYFTLRGTRRVSKIELPITMLY